MSMTKWTPVGVWGHDGWDLGSWPLVVVSFRDEGEGSHWPFGVMVNTEGDRERHFFATAKEREEWVSEWARWWYFHEGKPNSMTTLACLSGPYREGGRALCPECRKADSK